MKFTAQMLFDITIGLMNDQKSNSSGYSEYFLPILNTVLCFGVLIVVMYYITRWSQEFIMKSKEEAEVAKKLLSKLEKTIEILDENTRMSKELCKNKSLDILILSHY